MKAVIVFPADAHCQGEVAVCVPKYFSKNILSDICKTNIRSFCFPFGGNSSYNSNVLAKLEDHGYSESFSVNPQPIKDKFLKPVHRFELPRYDCNLF